MAQGDKLVNLDGLKAVYDHVDGGLSTKAEQDGYYADMTVGDAEQLVSTQYVEDKVPFLYRTTGGSADVGNRAYVDAITGGTVCWNQQLDYDNYTWSGNGISLTCVNGKLTFTGTATVQSSFSVVPASIYNKTKPIYGHKYYLKLEQSGTMIYFGIYGSSGQTVSSERIFGCNVQNTTDAEIIFAPYGTGYSDGYTLKTALFDLTAMFGSTIADYLYSLEQATPGAGIAKLKSWGFFTKPYYAYNPGEMMHVSGLVSRDSVGFNQWDEEWEVGGYAYATGDKYAVSDRIRNINPIPVFPNTTYNIKVPAGFALFYYGADMSFIQSTQRETQGTFITPEGTHYLNIAIYPAYGTVYNHDISINLSWSGTHNGEYAPYEKHSYALDSTLTLRGIPKLDSANNLYYDGDRYLPSGKVERRLKEKTFNGTEDWQLVATGTNRVFRLYNAFGYDYIQNALSKAHIANWAQRTEVINNLENGGFTQWMFRTTVINNNTDILIVTPASEINMTLEQFKAKLSSTPLIVVALLATPTEEDADPYNPIQIVDDWGTEEYVTDSIVPVGEEVRYPANLRDKLQHLPDMASADGDYIVRQTGSQMALVPLTQVKELPDMPTTNGNYKLRVTVANGTPTLSWVSE